MGGQTFNKESTTDNYWIYYTFGPLKTSHPVQYLRPSKFLIIEINGSIRLRKNFLIMFADSVNKDKVILTVWTFSLLSFEPDKINIFKYIKQILNVKIIQLDVRSRSKTSWSFFMIQT